MTTVEKRNAGEVQLQDPTFRGTPYAPISNRGIFLNWLKATTDAGARKWWLTPTTPSVTRLTTVPRSSNGMVLLPDGRVVFVPSANLGGIGIFDPRTNTYSTALTATLTDAKWGGVLLRDGRVAFIPRASASTNIEIYNPITNTTSLSVATMTAGVGKYIGGCVCSDGRVVMSPYDANNVGVWDPIADTFTTYGSIGGATRYFGAVAHPSGLVVFVPHSASSILTFNPATNTVTSAYPVSADSGKWRNGVLLPDGRIMFIPLNSPTIGLYEPVSNTFTEVSVPVGNGKYQSGCLTSTGLVVMAPNDNTQNIGLFDYRTNTFSTVPNSIVSTNSYTGTIALLDGRVLFCPSNTTALITLVSGFPVPPPEQCLHPSFNKL